MKSHHRVRQLLVIAASLAMTAGCTSSSSDAVSVESEQLTGDSVAPPDDAVVTAGNTTPAATSASSGELGLDWSVLGTFDLQEVSIRRVYVLVPTGLGDAEIVRISDVLRSQADVDPANDDVEFVEHYLMDDASQIDTLLAELPNTQAGDSSSWPVDYVVEHTVADSKLFLVPDDEGGALSQYWLCRGAAGCGEDETLAVYDASV